MAGEKLLDHVARFAIAIVSMCFVLWLLYAELIIMTISACTAPAFTS